MQQISSLPGVPAAWAPAVRWLFVFGEPGVSIPGFAGGLITWIKVVGLFALLAWLLSWVVASYRTRIKVQADWLDIAGGVALLGSIGSVVLNVLQSTGRLRSSTIGGYSVATGIALACGAVILVWTERSLWVSIRRLGKASDAVVALAIHLAIGLGVLVSFLILGAQTAAPGSNVAGKVPVGLAIASGVRLGATYMGFVVLAKVLWLLVPEILAMRPRRLYSIASLSITESTRKMWAPWVVIVIFLVILAFTHWFLPVQRPAELGRIFVGTLSLLCMLLLTVMVTVLAPLSLPQDIQAQTIYTVVSKPVRRLELIWGRMIGYMTDRHGPGPGVRAGSASLYLYREIIGRDRSPTIEADAEADKIRSTDPDRARFLDEQAEQLQSRMSARVPVKGARCRSSTREGRRPMARGIDVGQELEFRSHIEGGTPSAAIWHYGAQVVDPYRAEDACSTAGFRWTACSSPGRSRGSRTARCSSNTGSTPSNGGRPTRASRPPMGRRSFRRVTGTRAEQANASSASSRRSSRTSTTELAAKAKKARSREEGSTRPTEVPSGRRRRSALAADPDRDDLHDLPDHEGARRRPGLRRDRGREPPDEPPQVPRHIPDPRVLHEQAAASRRRTSSGRSATINGSRSTA